MDQDFRKCLIDEGFDESAIEIFRREKIDRRIVVTLDAEDMKELGFVTVGDRRRVKSLIQRLKEMVKPAVVATVDNVVTNKENSEAEPRNSELSDLEDDLFDTSTIDASTYEPLSLDPATPETKVSKSRSPLKEVESNISAKAVCICKQCGNINFGEKIMLAFPTTKYLDWCVFNSAACVMKLLCL